MTPADTDAQLRAAAELRATVFCDGAASDATCTPAKADAEHAALVTALSAIEGPGDRFACVVAVVEGGGSTDPPTVLGTLDVAAALDSCGGAAYLANVCTAPDARRRGVGRALLVEAARRAAGWGADTLFVHAASGDGAAAGLYEGAGFSVVDEGDGKVLYRGPVWGLLRGEN